MILDDIGKYLQALEYGTLGTDLFLNFKPDDIDCVVIFLTGGNPPRVDLELDLFTIQIRVINSDFTIGFNKIKSIKKEFHNQLITFSSNVYFKVYTEITTWYEDERWNFSINLECDTRRI